MHQEQKDFCKWVKRRHPEYFMDTKVLDIGSLDINGNNRYLFNLAWLNRCTYVGIDIFPGRNVDAPISCANYLRELKILMDVIISTEMLEHDQTWRTDVRLMYEHLRIGGLLLITAAGEGRPEHGTSRSHPGDSPGTPDYYENIEYGQLADVLKPYQFSVYHLEYNSIHKDIYFYGIKA